MDFPISVPSIGLVNGQFVDEDALLGTPGSLIPSVWGNSITREVLAVIEAAGLAPSEADLTQLLKAIRLLTQGGSASFGADTGAANVYAVAYSPVVSVLTNGLVLRFKAKTANTAASTFSPNGAVAKSLVGLGLGALQGGEIVANGLCTVMYSVTLDQWVLLSSTGGALQVANASKSQHAPSIGQLQAGFGSYAPDSGALNTIVATLSPAPVALVDGMLVRVLMASGNSGATTLNLNGLGAKAVQGMGAAALQGGELVAGGRATFIWAAAQNAWILQSCQAGSLQVADGSQSHHAVAIGQLAALGMIKTVKRQVITASGTYIPSPGLAFADVEACSAGAGGGGAQGGSGTSACGAGGASGSYAKRLFTAAQIGASQTVTIGAAGTAGVPGNNAGGNGGTTTFGALITCPGGNGGAGSLAATTAGIPAAGGSGNTPSGGDVNVKGCNGFASFTLGGSAGGLSGQGGASPYGSAGYPSGPLGSGNTAFGFGAGGSGGATNTAGNAAGGAGAPGLVIVTEYCTQ